MKISVLRSKSVEEIDSACKELQDDLKKDPTVAEVEERLLRLSTLGLEGLCLPARVKHAIAKLRVIFGSPASPKNFYPAIYPEEMEIWREWFTEIESPTKYNKPMPDEILREIEIARKLPFDNLEIRSFKEGPCNDSMLIGYVGGIAYHIASWGINSPSLDEVKSILEKAEKLNNRNSKLYIAFFLFLFILLLPLCIWGFWCIEGAPDVARNPSHATILFWVDITACVLFGAFLSLMSAAILSIVIYEPFLGFKKYKFLDKARHPDWLKKM